MYHHQEDRQNFSSFPLVCVLPIPSAVPLLRAYQSLAAAGKNDSNNHVVLLFIQIFPLNMAGLVFKTISSHTNSTALHKPLFCY